MYKRIVVGTDGSPTATEAVQTAAALAAQCGAELHVVSAFKPISALITNPEFASISAALYDEIDPAAGAKDVTERACEALSGCQVTQHQVVGAAADALCDVAATIDADLVVVGSRGMTGARRVLGSVPNSVAHHAPCSVLIVDTKR
jgi:nucleotide-binding universal stress UspA family protein